MTHMHNYNFFDNNDYTLLNDIIVIPTIYVCLAVLAPTCQQHTSELLKDSVACRYERLAVQLGLSPDTIEVITMNHRYRYRCLINVINCWVNNYQVSWSMVTKALENIV